MAQQFIYNINEEVIYDSRKKQQKNNYIKKLTKLFKNPVSFITTFTAIALVLAGINGVLKYSYYGIGWSLFSYDPRWVFPKILEFLIVWLLLVGTPIMYYKSLNEHDSTIKLLKFVFFSLVCCFCYFKYDDLIIHYLKDLTGSSVARLMSIIISIVGFNTAFYTVPFLKVDSLTGFKYIKKLFCVGEKIKVRNIISVIFLGLKILCMMIIYIIFIIITGLNIIGFEQETDTKNYVTTVIDGHDKIVLFEANDKVFLADFKIDKKKNCIIYTKKYSIMELVEHEYENIEVRNVIVEKNKEKPKK